MNHNKLRRFRHQGAAGAAAGTQPALEPGLRRRCRQRWPPPSDPRDRRRLHATEALAIWKADYNTVRPHSGLGDLPPAAYAKLSAPVTQRGGALRSTAGSAPRTAASPSQTRPKSTRGG